MVVCETASTPEVVGTDVLSSRLALPEEAVEAAVKTGLVGESWSDEADSVKANVLDDAVLVASDTRASVVPDATELTSSTSTLLLAVPTAPDAVSEAEPGVGEASGLVSDSERASVAVSVGLVMSCPVVVLNASTIVAESVPDVGSVRTDAEV